MAHSQQFFLATLLLCATATAFSTSLMGTRTSEGRRRTSCIRAASGFPPVPPPLPPPTSDGDNAGDGDDGSLSFNALLAAAGARLLEAVKQLPPPRDTLRRVGRVVRTFPPVVPVLLFTFLRPFRRAVRSQLHIIPILAQLTWFEKARRFSDEPSRLRARDALDARLSTDFANFIGSMRGAFVKVAQARTACTSAAARPMCSHAHCAMGHVPCAACCVHHAAPLPTWWWRHQW